MERYQFVLIDSRTGLTDSSGICTRVMPSALVAVFAPNEQNLEGLSNVIRASLEYRWESRDPRQITVYPLASRIDGQVGDLREIWWHGGTFAGRKIRGYQDRFEELFRDLYDLPNCDLGTYFDETQLPHDSAYAYGERIASLSSTSDSLSIGSKCANLAARLRIRALPWESINAASAKVVAAEAEAASAKRQAEALEGRVRKQQTQALLSFGFGLVTLFIAVVVLWTQRNSPPPVRLLLEVIATDTIGEYSAGSVTVPGLLQRTVRSDGKRQFIAAFGYTVATSDRQRTIARLDILAGDSLYRSITTAPQPSGWAREDSLVLPSLPIGEYVFRLSDLPELGSTSQRNFVGTRYLRVYDAQ